MNSNSHGAILAPVPARRVADGIVECREHGLTILRPDGRGGSRRVLFLNSYGGAPMWDKIKRGLMPGHHLWGCIELVRLGYEVGLAEPLPHFDFRRRPLPHDLKLWPAVHAWLRRDDILYCGHTLLYWLPLLRRIRQLKCAVVSLTYARETLDFARAHSGIIALTPAAVDQAKKAAPRVKVAHLGWGTDLAFFPRLDYRPQWHLSCGITCRDFTTLRAAAARCTTPIRIIAAGHAEGWPPHVTVLDNRAVRTLEQADIPHRDLIHEHYAGATASLVVLKRDPGEQTAVGFTNVLEAMALARPVVVTRTGAIPGEIDVEAAGCGIHVPAEDPAALAKAMSALAADPAQAQQMGCRGRQLAERHYNIERYSQELHAFFDRL